MTTSPDILTDPVEAKLSAIRDERKTLLDTINTYRASTDASYALELEALTKAELREALDCEAKASATKAELIDALVRTRGNDELDARHPDAKDKRDHADRLWRTVIFPAERLQRIAAEADAAKAKMLERIETEGFSHWVASDAYDLVMAQVRSDVAETILRVWVNPDIRATLRQIINSNADRLLESAKFGPERWSGPSQWHGVAEFEGKAVLAAELRALPDA